MKDHSDEVSPKKALELLKAGNADLVGGRAGKRDWLEEVKNHAGGQKPFAAVVSCLDSRIPPEIVFNQGIGDLFVARVAGNFVNDDILGSLEFAAGFVKLIVILGHTGCGAVEGACADEAPPSGLLATTLANINPAVLAVREAKPGSPRDAEFVNKVARKNVELNLQKLRARSIALRERLADGSLGLVGAMYDLSTGRVHWIET